MGKFNQILTSLAVSMGTFIMGFLTVWPSYTASIYLAENNTVLTVPMTESEMSLVGSLPSLGAMFGTFVAGIITDKFGRKNGGIAILLPFVISWAIIMVATTPIPIYIARFISGASGGGCLLFAPLFISETAEDSIRGTLASGPVALYCLGALSSYLLGWFSNYRTIAMINILFGIFNVALLMLVAESPVFLLKQNREKEARDAIAYYRGGDPNSKIVNEELALLKHKLAPQNMVAVKTETVDDVNKETVYSETGGKVKKSALMTLFTVPSSRRPFFAVIFFGLSMVLMGVAPVQIYAESLFSVAAPNLSSSFCSVLLAIMLLVGSMIPVGFADVFGRKILQLTSSICVAIIMLLLGYLLWSRVAPAWVSAVLLLLYCFCFNFGIGTVPFILMCEVFAPEVQSLASMIFLELIWFSNFFVITIFPLLSKIVGVHGTFAIFGIVGIINSIATYFILPETKGLSNDEIQEAFMKRK